MASNSTPGVFLTADEWDALCVQLDPKPVELMDEDEDEDEDVDAVTGEDEDDTESEGEEGETRKKPRF